MPTLSGVTESYSLWTRRYWFFMLFGSSIVYLAFDILSGLAIERPYYIASNVLLGSLTLLSGSLVLTLPLTFKRAQAFFVSSVLLALAFEVSAWSGHSQTRLSVPVLLAFVCMLSRLAPSLSLTITGLGLFGSLVCTAWVEHKYHSFFALLSDQSILWMTAYLCFLESRRAFTVQSELIDAFTDHLMYSATSPKSAASAGPAETLTKQGNYYYYDMNKEHSSYITRNWLRPVYAHLWSSMEKRYRVWVKARHTEFFTKHSLFVAAEAVLLVVIIAPYKRFELSSPVFIVQVVAITVLVGSLVLASFARLSRSTSLVYRARLGFLTSLGFLLASAVFASVYSVVNTRQAVSHANVLGLQGVQGSISNTPIDVWLLTSIASFVVLDVMSWIMVANAVVLCSGVVYVKFWAMQSAGVILVYVLQYLLLFAVLLIHKVAMGNAMRVLFLFADGGSSGSSRSRVVVEGVQSQMSSKRTLYSLRVDEVVSIVSTVRLRERLWRLKDKQYVIDEYFDKLPVELDRAAEAAVMRRLSTLLSRIARRLSEEEFVYVFGRRRVPKMNVTIQTVGSRGDVQPFLLVARELLKAGHSVVLATHEKFRKFVQDAEIAFFPLALVRDDHWQPEQLMRYAESNPAMGPELLVRPKALYQIVSNAPEMTQTLRTVFLPPEGQAVTSAFGPLASVANADALIANPPSYAHVHLAEAFGIPLHLVFTMPWTPTRTVGHPLCVSSAQTNAFWKELSYRYMEFLQWRGVNTAVNAFRSSMGLSRHNSTDASIVDKWRVPFTYMFSQVLLPKPPDWGAHIDVTGFVVEESGSHASFQPPANLASFLTHTPVYVGFGSISSDLSQLYRQVLSACRAFPTVKFLIHKGWAPLTALHPEDFPENAFLLCPSPPTSGESWEARMLEGLGADRVCFLPSIPHPWLFPQCAAVVHHGGAGTTAAGLALGRPTVVCAFFGDQAIWGQMVGRLRCGAMVLAREATAAKFTEAFEFTLSSEAQKHAQEVASALELEKQRGAGAKAVVEAFENQMAVELVTCELCEVHKADRVCDTFQVQACADCGAAVGDFQETPLRRVDWGHSRHSSVVTGAVSRISKAIIKLKTRPIQGFDAIGILGLVSGFVLAVLELLFELGRLPYHFIVNVVHVGDGEAAPAVLPRDLERRVVPGNVDKLRTTVLELKLLRVKIALAKKQLPQTLLSENLHRLRVIDYTFLRW